MEVHMKINVLLMMLLSALLLAACATTSSVQRTAPTGQVVGECTETEFVWAWDITHYPKTSTHEAYVKEVCVGLTGNTCSAVLTLTGGASISETVSFTDGSYMNLHVTNPCLAQ